MKKFTRYLRPEIVSLVIVILLFMLALLAPWIAPVNTLNPINWEMGDSLRPPMWIADEEPWAVGRAYPLGTDLQGRDLLSAIIFGLRISLMVSLSVVAISSVIGTSLGLLAGYVGGKVDAVIMRLADIWLSFPSILLALFIMAVWGSSIGNLITAIVIVRWVAYARTARGCVLAEREKDYVAAARALGQRPVKIMFRHILPNIISPLGIIAAVEVAMVTMLEATLSFLGVGVPIDKPSLGMLIKEGFGMMMGGQWWLITFPGLTLIIMVFSVNVLVDWLRDRFNPHLSKLVN